MNTNVKGNNKGFSLVELIVVMAIMAILAVTLAPRLSSYVEKSRMASDQEAVNTIFSAAKLTNAETPLPISTTVDLGDATTNALYTISADGKTWTLNSSYADATNGKFFDNLKTILGNFKLKSQNVAAETQITLATDASGYVSVTLDYDGAGPDSGYVVTE